MSPLSDLIAKMIPGGGPVPDALMGEVWVWAQSMAGALIRHVPMVLMSGAVCGEPQADDRGHVYACGRGARALCGACRRATCLNHAFFNGAGEALCYSCGRTAAQVAEAAFQSAPQRPRQGGPQPGPGPGVGPQHASHGHAPPPPPPNQRPQPTPQRSAEVERRARIVLGIADDATREEGARAAKKAWAKVHPDKATSPEDKAWRTAEFRKITEALEYLKATAWKDAA